MSFSQQAYTLVQQQEQASKMPSLVLPLTLLGLSSSTDENNVCPSPPSAANLADLELFHNFVSHTYCTIGPEEQDHTPWRDEIPSLALSHPFLLHAILGLSAAHEPSQADPSAHMSEQIARQHYDTSLRLFRESFHGVTCPETATVFQLHDRRRSPLCLLGVRAA